MIHVRHELLVRFLLAHGEEELVERVPSLTEEQLTRIGQRAEHYAFSAEHAPPSGASMGVSRAGALATVEVLEGTPREPRRQDGQRAPEAEMEALRRLNLSRSVPPEPDHR